MSKLQQKEQEFCKSLNELEKHEETGDINILLFGSSIIRHLRHKKVRELVWDEYVKPLKAFNLGVSDNLARNTKEHIHAAQIENLKNLRAVLIHVGSNDTAHCISPEDVANTVIECACDVTIHNPHVHVIVSSVLPRCNPKLSDVCGDENAVMAVINRRLHDLCGKCNFVFMQNWVDTAEKDLYRDDGIHLSLKGSVRFASKIRDTINALAPKDPLSPVTAVTIACNVSSPAYKNHWYGSFDYKLHNYAIRHAGAVLRKLDSHKSAPLVPLLNESAVAHASHAANLISAALNVDLPSAFRALSISNLAHDQPLRTVLKKTIDELSSDDTDTEPQWTDRVKKKS